MCSSKWDSFTSHNAHSFRNNKLIHDDKSDSSISDKRLKTCVRVNGFNQINNQSEKLLISSLTQANGNQGNFQRSQCSSVSSKICIQWMHYTETSMMSEELEETKIPSVIEQNRPCTVKQDYIMKKYWKLWLNHANAKKVNTFQKQFCEPRVNEKEKSKRGNVINHKNNTTNVTESTVKSGESNDMEVVELINKKPPANFKAHLRGSKIDEQQKLVENMRLTQLMLETETFSKDSLRMLRDSFNNSEKTIRNNAVGFINCALKNKSNYVKKYTDTWQYVTKMEERAKQRKEKWEHLQQNKQHIEEERLRQIKLKEEEDKKRIDEEKKRKFLEFKAEKLKQEKMRKQIIEEREHLKLLDTLATEHYKRKLLHYGLKKLNENVVCYKTALEVAKKLYDKNVLFKYFTKWKFIHNITIRNKILIAEKMYNDHLLRRSFDQLIRIYRERMNSYEAAYNIYNFKVQKNAYYAWKCYVYKKRYEDKKKQQEMLEYYNRKLLSRSFQRWKNLQLVLFQEREKEQRLRTWRVKVQETLPDFELQE